jgi:hypothetical protein
MVWAEGDPVPVMRIETIDVGTFHTSQLGGALQTRKQRSVASLVQRTRVESGVTPEEQRYLDAEFGPGVDAASVEVGGKVPMIQLAARAHKRVSASSTSQGHRVSLSTRGLGYAGAWCSLSIGLLYHSPGSDFVLTFCLDSRTCVGTTRSPG